MSLALSSIELDKVRVKLNEVHLVEHNAMTNCTKWVKILISLRQGMKYIQYEDVALTFPALVPPVLEI